MMRGFLLVFAFLAALAGPSQAQNVNLNCYTGPSAPQWVPCSPNLKTKNAAVTIALGNTFQSVFSAVTSGTTTTHSITIQNNNTNGDNCWLFIGENASATKGTSILLGPGGSYQRYFPYLPSDNISATCTTTSDTMYVDSQ